MRERSLIAATKVMAGAEVYAHKAGLRKREGKVIGLWSRTTVVHLAAAASIALFLGLGIWSLMRAPRQVPKVAEVKETKSEPGSQEAPKQEGIQQNGHEVVPRTMQTNAEEERRTTEEEVPVHEQNPSTPEPRRTVREEAPALAHLEPVKETHSVETNTPVQAKEQQPAASIPPPDEFLAAAPSTAKQVPTLGGLVAQRVRGAVLDQSAPDAHAFQEADAGAAVDKGLKRLSSGRS